MSAFKSIRDIVKDQAGNYMQYVVQERFNNMAKMPKIKSPLLLIHGLNDKLISCKHSEDLAKICSSYCEVVTPKNMDHNTFNVIQDLILPFQSFERKV